MAILHRFSRASGPAKARFELLSWLAITHISTCLWLFGTGCFLLVLRHLIDTVRTTLLALLFWMFYFLSENLWLICVSVSILFPNYHCNLPLVSMILKCDKCNGPMYSGSISAKKWISIQCKIQSFPSFS